MGKSIYFTGQPVFSQLLKLIPIDLVPKLARKHHADKYCKKFDSHHHLVSMLFAVINQCTSIREVITGMQVASPKLGHLKLTHNICRSTFADANIRRPEAFFGDLFHQLYRFHYVLPDSRSDLKAKPYEQRLFIMDATTIKLFHDVLKGAGEPPKSGKRKGGLKAHVMIKASEDVPCLVNLSAAAANDRTFLKHTSLAPGSIITFDKGYTNFRQFDQWTKSGVTWVSRTLDQWIVQTRKNRKLSSAQIEEGVISDELVTLGAPKEHNKTIQIKARIIRFVDKEKNKEFSFVTNNTKFLASTIADIYKRRWQIELLFKRIKQRYPLRYFLGDSANAIKIQVWCALIVDLLIKIVKDKIKRKWAYSNLSGMVRLHLMTYINLFGFLENPEKELINYHHPHINTQLNLFSSV
ncbi:MAG: IS4 family transposase [Bacteroidia bacterium]